MSKRRTFARVLAAAAVALPVVLVAGTSEARTLDCLPVTDDWEYVEHDVAGYAVDVNNAGQIVGGLAQEPGSRRQAFVWQNGNLTRLPALTPQGEAAVRAIDDQGRVVGSDVYSYLTPEGVLWENGRARHLPGGLPNAIGKGVIAGNGVEKVGPPAYVLGKAMRWTGSAWTDLNVTRGSETIDANEAGQITGTHKIDTSAPHPTRQLAERAYVWSAGSVRELGTLGGGWSSAKAMNDLGHVIGHSGTATDHRAFPFLWTPSAGIKPLALDDIAFGAAADINDAGTIVGSYSCQGHSSSPSFPVVWTSPDALPLLLPAPSATLIDAVAINDNGLIAGSVWTASGPRLVTWRPKPAR
ncbi:hypothetical protein [Bailinhaonella thermotolerans]|uniref:hypothetical protein n=1 Tax=Bailinhaonella thermotolerans TaxID=1070861 RepID=UPI00192A2771|nr:hypothetical protein [Bailinhaonella thermotolerans]